MLNSNFARNVAIVASGTAAAQAIGMAFTPFITRLYGPEAFGLLGVFTSLTGVLVPVAALTYPIAIVLPKEDSDARGIARLSLYIAFVVSTLVAVALYVGGEKLLTLLDSQTIAPYVMLIPLFMLFAACQQIARQWLIRKKQFSITARVAVLQAFIINSAKSGFGWFNPVGAVLILLATGGQAFHAAMLWIGIRKSKHYQNGEKRESTSLKVLAKRHRDFPIYRMPQMLVNSLSLSLPVLLLSSFFGPTVVGLYTLTRKVLWIPVTLIGQSISTVFYPQFSEKINSGKCGKNLLVKSCITLGLIGFFPFLLLFIFGPELFSLVFGQDWDVSGEFARWMALWLFFVLITRPVIAAIPVLSLQGVFLFLEFFALILRASAISIGYFLANSAMLSIGLFSLVNVLVYLVLMAIVLRKSGVTPGCSHRGTA
ncbi:MAG: oligosaccharide flippase family protein [Spirochaetaceae bacterium]|nr:oligosaccharide flippase family protein [Spirochaetaceae bacterium]MCF7947176.1 oligosaccharide flippase family protein [Spirochaetia bacterium]MCF7950041.1 oligosaccharide flippase family protein [Spirochaetaceae bacterium]